MRLYSREEEERIRAQREVRAWIDEGLLDPPQGARLLADLKVELRRTNPFLRAGLALFTVLIAGAVVGLMAVLLGLRESSAFAILATIVAAGCLASAEYLVRVYRCYRHGVEEALAVAAVALLAVSALEFAKSVPVYSIPWLVAAAGGFGLYRRYGFVYAAVAGLACAAAIPFQFEFQLPSAAQRFLAASVVAAAGFVIRAKRLRYGDEYPGDEYGMLQAAALAGVYLMLNVQLSPGWYVVSGWFYWFTYIAIWILPAAGLLVGAREKDRVLIDISLALLIVTLVTNKPYLGWERHTWDPCLLGIVAVAVAMGMRRWLSSGPGGVRLGFTAAALLDRDRSPLATLGTLSTALPSVVPTSSAATSTPSAFDGGRSGGGGGGAAY
jgi:hypothetical protein